MFLVNVEFEVPDIPMMFILHGNILQMPFSAKHSCIAFEKICSKYTPLLSLIISFFGIKYFVIKSTVEEKIKQLAHLRL